MPDTTYQILDRLGEIYNLPANPTEFILKDINNIQHLSSNGTELINNSKNLEPFKAATGGSAEFPPSSMDGLVLKSKASAAEKVEWEALPNYALDADLDTEIVNRANADSVLSNRITGLEDKNSSLTDKMLHYWNSTVGKWVSSAIEILADGKANFNNFLKSKYYFFDTDTNSNTTPDKLRSDGLRLKFTGSNGVEKDTAFLEDITDDSRKLLKRYIHTSNREITHTAVDYATGYVTATAHGFTHSGQKLVGLFVNGLAKQLPSYVPTGIETLPDSYTIPYEWLQADIYVKVIDANTLMICNASGAIITVNPTSAQNTGRIDSTKWHIEDFGECDFSDIPQGSQRVEIVVKGFTMGRGFSSATRYIQPLIHSTDNSIRWIDGNADAIPSIINLSIDIGTSRPYVVLTATGTTNKQCIYSYVQIKLELKDTIGLKQATESLSFWGGTLRNVNTTVMAPSLASVGKNKGIAGLRITSSAMVKEPVFFANNTVIEVYKL